MTTNLVLQVKNLHISFSQYVKGLKRQEIKVISDLDIDLREGEIMAVVGASGSGKSLLAHAILGILPGNASLTGDIYYREQALSQKDKERLRKTDIALIPQSVNYLDPLLRVGDQIGISIKDKSRRSQVIAELFQKYCLKEEVARYYPFQLSGGMARKVLLATALASNARVIIADEPTPGLDAASLNEILQDFKDLSDNGRSILMITHDIEAALTIADRIAVFYAGATVEMASAKDFKKESDLRHPYAKALNKARPSVSFQPLAGIQPFSGRLSGGCLFCDRCPVKTSVCDEEAPILREIRDGKVRCHHAT